MHWILIVREYPAITLFNAVTSNGEELPIEIGVVKAVEEPVSNMLHEVISQLVESEFEK
jgi:hypothetical protein